MTQALTFPAPETGDAEDVVWTLQTGGTMWARGDHHEAVRWLRRAAEAAGDAGQDQRALALARSAADLTSALELPPSIPPPPAVPKAPPPAPQRASPPVAQDKPTPPKRTAHSARATGRSRPRPPPVRDDTMTEITAQFIHPSRPGYRPPIDDGISSENTIVDIREPAPQPPPPPRARAAPPPARSSQSATPPPAPSSQGASPTPTRSSPSAAPPPARSSPVAAPPPSRSSPSAAPPPAVAVRQRQALRVAVTPSPDDKNLLLVRPLLDEEPVPSGAHEALLTALEPGAHLLTKKR